MATLHGHEAVVGQLSLAASVSVGEATTEERASPLVMVAESVHEAVGVKLLAAAAVDVKEEAATDERASPQVIAVEYRHDSCRWSLQWHGSPPSRLATQ